MSSRPPAIGGIGRGRPINQSAQAPAPGNQDLSAGNNAQGRFNQGAFGQSTGGFGGQGGNYNQSSNNSGFGGRGSFQQSNGYGDQSGSFNQSNSSGYGSQSGGFNQSANSGFGQPHSGFGQSPGSGFASGGFGGHEGGGGSRSGGNSNACRNCGEIGHFARECGKAKSFGDKKSSVSSGCFKCGSADHIARNCPNDQGNQANGGGFRGGSSSNGGFGASAGGFGFGQSDGDSFTSSATGHMENGFGTNGQDRPPRGRGRGTENGPIGSGCFKCGEFGHISRDCPNPGSNDAWSGGRSNNCYRCDKPGHMAKDCTEDPATAAAATGRKPPSTYVPVEAEIESLWQQHIATGINFDRYYDIPVTVTGMNANLSPITSFVEARLTPQLLKNVQLAGFNTPTPIQQYAMPYLLAGRDIMACAQTGSGKTAAFLLPILTAMSQSEALMVATPGERQQPVVIAIAPTRELAIQIKDEARKFSAGTAAKVASVYGGTSVMHQRNVLRQGCSILIGTIGRMLDFVDRGHIDVSKCKYLILDEADRMLDMGFESDVRRLVQRSEMPPKSERQTLMFSATFPQEIQQLASEFLNEHIFIKVGEVGAANRDITQELILLKDKNLGEKRDMLSTLVLRTMNASKNEEGKFRKKAIIFVERKRVADALAAGLIDPTVEEPGVPATSLHSDREQKQREEVMQWFRSGEYPILVATDVAARGLDIQDVDYVYNFDLPRSIDDYVHRIGRTARVGNVGRAISFFDPICDTPIAKDLLRILEDAQQEVPEWLRQLAQDGYLNSNESEDSGWQ